MKIKSSFFLFFLIVWSVKSQDYIDVFKLTNTWSTLSDKKGIDETKINNLNIEAFFPVPLNKKIVGISALSAERTVFNIDSQIGNEHLEMIRLNLGIKVKHSEKWSGLYAVLPRVSSCFKTLNSADFQIGGIALFDYQLSEILKIKWGIYGSSECFGMVITPLIGLWYQSKNKKFYINASLPTKMDVNYTMFKRVSVGVDLLTSIKSYNLSESGAYVQEESTRFSFYSAFELMKKTLFIKGKVGVNLLDFGLYESHDKMGLKILSFGFKEDQRIRLNSKWDPAIFFGGEIIYRFDLNN